MQTKACMEGAAMLRKKIWELKKYLILSISSLIIACSIALLVIPAKMYETSFSSQAQVYCQDLVRQAATGLSSSLNLLDYRIDEVVHNPRVAQMLRARSATMTEVYDYHKIIVECFNPHQIDSHYIQEIDLYLTRSGACLEYGSKPVALTNAFSSDYYRKAIKNTPLRNNWIGYNGEADCIEIARIAYDEKTYEILGLFIIRLSPDFLQDKFESFNPLEMERMYITDADGYVLCSNAANELGAPLGYVSPERIPGTGVLETREQIIAHCQLMDVSAEFPYHKWSVILGINKQILLQDFHAITGSFTAIAAAIVLAGVILTVRLSRSITHPIGGLVGAMGAVRGGDMKMQIHTNSNIQEIRQAYQGFNDMAHQLDVLINTVYQNELIHRETQLKVLQNQINPHFLFNTLQTVSWKAHEYEADPVCSMIESLCYMLSVNLHSGDENLFTMREELAYIQRYSSIVQSKYQGKIRFVVDVPKDLYDCMIPKLILQPFLENSIVHGLAPKSSPGTLSLKVMRDGANLIAEIRDDGVGMHSDILHGIRQQDDNGPENTHSIALKNINRRIRLLYGEPYDFEMHSRLFEGTAITLTIPYQKEPPLC